MADLATILAMTPDEVPDPVTLTPGVYEFTVLRYKHEEVGENKTPKLTYSVRADAVVDDQSDLDEEQLRVAKPLYMEYWLTEGALSNEAPHISAKRFILDALEVDAEGATFAELFEMAIGQTFKGKVDIEMQGKNKDRPTPVIKRVLVG